LLNFARRLEGGGVVLLSTCNRVEFYISHPAHEEEIEKLVSTYLSESHQIPEAEFRDALYMHHGREAVGHLFRVAASLDSLVVGEVQILGQVHDAYLMAQAEQTTDKVIHALFQKAFSLAKNVRTQTSIGAGKVSVSSVAVDLAASIFGDLHGKTVMVVGSGEMAELTLKSLVDRGVESVIVINRSPERAEALAAAYQGEAQPFEELDRHLHRADILISTTAAPRTILHAPAFCHALRHRRHAPILVIDIAVPRDVDADVGQVDNVYLYNVDDLEQVVNENLEARRKEIDQAMELVEKAVDQFMHWWHGLAAEPTIVSMSEEFDQIRERELRKTLAALPDLNDGQREEIAYLTKRIVRSILQRPMSGIKNEIAHHDPHTVIHLVKRLFGISETP
jgi:glutamyl-tRNA reductase